MTSYNSIGLVEDSQFKYSMFVENTGNNVSGRKIA